MKKILILAVFCLACKMITFAQIEDLPNNSNSDKCFAKVLSPNTYETKSLEYPIYIGDNVDHENVQRIMLEVSNAHTVWIQKKLNGKDKTWCLVELEPLIEELYVVQDTNKLDEFILETFEITEYKDDGGFKEWKEVICAKDINYRLVSQLENSMYERGYYDSEISGKMNMALKYAIYKYQKDFGLSIGELTIETLNELRIIY